MYNVQDYSFLYNNAVPPVLCKGWHFTFMWKMTAPFHCWLEAWPIKLVKHRHCFLLKCLCQAKKVSGHVCVCVKGIDFASFCDSDIWLWYMILRQCGNFCFSIYSRNASCALTLIFKFLVNISTRGNLKLNCETSCKRNSTKWNWLFRISLD